MLLNNVAVIAHCNKVADSHCRPVGNKVGVIQRCCAAIYKKFFGRDIFYFDFAGHFPNANS